MKTYYRAAQTILWLLMLALSPFGLAHAQVQVTSADPSSTVQGTVSLDVTINGSGFDSSADVKFLVTGTTDSGGITVKKVSVRNSRRLVATIEVADTAVVNKFDIEVTLSSGRKGKGTTLFAVQAKTDACTGATATFVYSKGATNATKTLYVANETATCTRLLYTFANSYGHYASFRVVSSSNGQEGRVVTTDGGSLLLLRFHIGDNMTVDRAAIVVQPIFDSIQAGNIDVNAFELAQDGHKLVFVTLDEDGGGTRLTRLRYITDVDLCVPASPGGPSCMYSIGTLLAETTGAYYRLGAPRWNTDGSWIYLRDGRDTPFSPYISRVSLDAPLLPGTDPEIVMSGNALTLLELKLRGSEEVLAYGERSGTGCRDVRVVLTSSCGSGICANQINSTSPRVLFGFFGSLASIDSTSMTILTEGASENRKGDCIASGQIIRAIDSSTTGVQVNVLVSGALPAAR